MTEISTAWNVTRAVVTASVENSVIMWPDPAQTDVTLDFMETSVITVNVFACIKNEEIISLKYIIKKKETLTHHFVQTQACPSGTYGRNCSQECGPNCNPTCDRFNGVCELGCSPGWKGPHCNTSNYFYNYTCYCKCISYIAIFIILFFFHFMYNNCNVPQWPCIIISRLYMNMKHWQFNNKITLTILPLLPCRLIMY